MKCQSDEAAFSWSIVDVVDIAFERMMDLAAADVFSGAVLSENRQGVWTVENLQSSHDAVKRRSFKMWYFAFNLRRSCYGKFWFSRPPYVKRLGDASFWSDCDCKDGVKNVFFEREYFLTNMCCLRALVSCNRTAYFQIATQPYEKVVRLEANLCECYHKSRIWAQSSTARSFYFD